MGWREEDEEAGRWPAWGGEAAMWLGCLLAAVMPTALGLMAWRVFVGAVTPLAAWTTYVGVFTLMVLAIKPWTIR